MTTPLWELVNICKAFPGVRANDGISIRLNAGEIHALLGENGCGKSTLIKILSGVHQPDNGEIRLNGVPLTLGSPIDARTKGVATVFQEFSLAPTLSVAENIFLGRYPRRGPFVDWARMQAEAERILASLEIRIDPRRLVGSLSVAEQQLVEIAKAISVEATLLILDEPTTALGAHEILVLHNLLRRMKSRGVAVLYISHRLDEVVELVDTATILKDGRVASTAEATRLDIPSIVTAMIGTSVDEHYPKEQNATNEVLIEVEGLWSAAGARGASFSVQRGEVFGLGGVIGSGRTEIARAVFGADKITGGRVRVAGRKLRLRSPRDAIAAGIALVPENRKFDGLFFNFNGGPNITSAAIGSIRRLFLLNKSEEARITTNYIRDLEISPAAATKFVNLLSGGNQQKIVIARWLFAQSQVLILDEPTQGIDIGAKIAVYRLINQLTARGCAVILISSDHAELIAMSDRIGIVRGGAVVETRPASQITHAHLVQASASAATAA
ncbi:ribose transport system ATP-binding protein [Gemmobacter aquatilis]|uniref:Ribose transport system ATP-binding protein n=1 Tax=Gemmobacter aquatilis TaxID=933059 RepID=A0A1H8MVV4_9RHOB|nr:sugar ABC transporter ATP-binding protein [Gemmobacter aquatilis]SEO21409.1 ribose transport system ATP-binding protein [Gemmobacter aquatilis]